VSSLHAAQIEQIAAWLAATDIGLLELRGPGQMLLLRHDGAGVEVVDVVQTDGAAAPAAPVLHTVNAPSVGVFLHRHPLREDTLAAPGSAVRAGQALGLLQVGLLLLPVLAPADATVLELLVAHGTVVGYGTQLFALQGAAPHGPRT